MSKLLSIGVAAKPLGVSVSTLRRWEKNKKLLAEKTTETPGTHLFTS